MLWGLWWGSSLSHGAEPFCDFPYPQSARHRPSLPGVHPPLSYDHGSLEFIRFLPEQPVGEATTHHQKAFQKIFKTQNSAKRKIQDPTKGPSL